MPRAASDVAVDSEAWLGRCRDKHGDWCLGPTTFDDATYYRPGLRKRSLSAVSPEALAACGEACLLPRHLIPNGFDLFRISHVQPVRARGSPKRFMITK